MKRASLNNLPRSAKTEPSDLTDRLLDREAPPTAEAAQAGAARAKPRKSTGGTRRPRAKKAAAAAPGAEPEPAPKVIEASDALAEALRQTEAAALALDSAAQQAPARYHLALRYRLDALAHHLRQVTEFVAAVGRK
jgi:hypothetical protein